MSEGPKQVTAYQGYGIYASYDAEAPDTADSIHVATKELAQRVCKELNKDPRSYNNLAYVEGCEHCKLFKYGETILPNADDFAATFEEAMAIANDDFEDEDEDGDD